MYTIYHILKRLLKLTRHYDEAINHIQNTITDNAICTEIKNWNLLHV